MAKNKLKTKDEAVVVPEIKKWFSLNRQNEQVQEITPSERVFSSSSNLFFWSRGLNEWVGAQAALEFFKKTPMVESPIVEETVKSEPKILVQPAVQVDEKVIEPSLKIEVPEKLKITKVKRKKLKNQKSKVKRKTKPKLKAKIAILEKPKSKKKALRKKTKPEVIKKPLTSKTKPLRKKKLKKVVKVKGQTHIEKTIKKGQKKIRVDIVVGQ